MQLLIILALLLYGSKGDTQKLISEVAPILETFGGEEVKQALKSAEDLTGVLNVVKQFTGSANQNQSQTFEPDGGFTTQNEQSSAIAFPLAPISNIADREITYSLSKYFAETK